MASSASLNTWNIQRRPESFTLSRGGEQVLSFDLAGRLITWFRERTLYKRALSSRVVARRRQEGERVRWTLSPAETAGLFADLWTQMQEVQGRQPLLTELERVLAWPPERLLAEQERFARAYAPVSILPPDQYFAVVVQATRGCSWNKCTFCTFYRDRPFTVQSPAAFAEHLQAVKELLGEAAPLRQSLFVADGNALMVANAKLLPLLEQARAAFPGRPLYGFLDVMTGSRKSLAEWSELREAGVRRVYLGLETGHDPLLAWLNKPGSADLAVELVTALKAAGLQVAPIFMLGVGGQRYAGAHVRDTLALLRRLPLSAGDLVYLSPFVEHGEYQVLAEQSGVVPLPWPEVQRQEQNLKDALREWFPEVRAARYDILEFLY